MHVPHLQISHLQKQRKKTSLLIALCIIAVLIAGCSRASRSQTASDRLLVVASTPQLADIARTIGGDSSSVEQLIPTGVDLHEFEPNPSDAIRLTGAKLILRSGGEIDAWLPDLKQTAGGNGTTLTLLTALPMAKRDGEQDHEHAGTEKGHEHTSGGDPHWWQNPRYVAQAALLIGREFAKADPGNAAFYQKNARIYAEKVTTLDQKIARCFRGIPAQSRKIVTDHDGLSYYAKRYQIPIVGTVIPGRSTQAQSSLGEVKDLVQTIRRERVRTIFPEQNVSAKLAATIAKQSGARLGPKLWVDTLAKQGSPASTYLGALRENTHAILAGIAGPHNQLPAQCQTF